MIARLSGKLAAKKPTWIVLDVNGVGYRVFVSLTTFYSLPDEGGAVSLDIYTHVREDAIILFGFSAAGEKEVFEKLIGVSKIGPKLGLTILSGMPFMELVDAVRRKDVGRLSLIPGVGKKTAERLTVELADKFTGFAATSYEARVAAGGGVIDDVVEALVALGYNGLEAARAAKAACSTDAGSNLETALREALKILSGPNRPGKNG
ncbi:MAG: Holliday junction branch migration protein RuvA [Nitrospinae bacterium]|nr:Holliday junction branch migration protein RuvA [Nitrospinota bacterium]